MKAYLLGRARNSAISLAGLIVLVFFLARLTGNPADLYLPLDVPAEVRHEFSEAHGFNDPLLVQFGRFALGLLQLDFGDSMRFHAPALTLVLNAFPTSLALAALSMGFALAIAVVTGSLGAWRPGGAFDRVTSLLSLAAASLPNFWVAIVGVLLFAVNWRVLPTSGTGGWEHWVLPVAVLVIRPAGLLAQVVRGSMMGTLGAGFIKTARAKGVQQRRIIFVHALRNAMLPAVTVAGDQAAGLINGAVVVEVIFGFPGIGKLMIDAITYRDFTVIQAGVLVTAVAIFVLNTAVDLFYALLDPRIRHA
ncbi:ABC transporter permease [Roseomonas elaeocarpi]|uniref:ABC transporter permease n=1 Tax=Roseomonas elaeocarpi TaxID=907779 RepID=A0ABV6JZG1_9PROT